MPLGFNQGANAFGFNAASNNRGHGYNNAQANSNGFFRQPMAQQGINLWNRRDGTQNNRNMSRQQMPQQGRQRGAMPAMPQGQPAQGMGQSRRATPVMQQGQSQQGRGMMPAMPAMPQGQPAQGMGAVPATMQPMTAMPQGMPNQQGVPQQGLGGAPANNFPPSGTDGVTYEPITEATLAEIRKSMAEASATQEKKPEGSATTGAAPSGPGIAPRTPERQSFEVQPDSMGTRLAEFIQSERNAKLYYQSLAERAPTGKFRRYLTEVSRECDNRREILGQLYKSLNGGDFSPEEREIERNIGFFDGISWAIEEESKTLRKLTSLYEQVADERAARKISTLIYKKMGDLSYLNLILN